MSCNYGTQNDLLLVNLRTFYCTEKNGAFNVDNNLDKMLRIISGESKISLRIVDWFATNYAKKNYTVYDIEGHADGNVDRRFKVHSSYKLNLKAYSKKRFDPFCRWDRISVPYKQNSFIETTIGQLNFFKWALENKIVKYIEDNYDEIEKDMNARNSTSRKKELHLDANSKTRKKREELSISATKSVKKEKIEITVKFD